MQVLIKIFKVEFFHVFRIISHISHKQARTNLKPSTEIREVFYRAFHITNCRHWSKSYEEIDFRGQRLIFRESSKANGGPLGMANVRNSALLGNTEGKLKGCWKIVLGKLIKTTQGINIKNKTKIRYKSII